MDKKKIFLVSLGHLSCDVNGGALPACLPYLRSALSLDYQATSGLMLAYSCFNSVIQPLMGFLADKLDRPWFIPFGVAMAGVGLALMGFLQNYWAIFGAIAIGGIGAAFFHPSAARFANKVSGKSKGMGLSIFSIGGNCGFLVGPLLVTIFVGHYGLEGMSVFAVISLAMAFVLLWLVARMPAARSDTTDTRALKKIATLSAVPASAEGDELAAAPTPRENAVNHWREFSKLGGVIVCRSISFVGCNSFIPFFWVNVLHQTPAAGAWALVIFNACGICFNMLGGLLSDRYGCISMIRLGFSVAPFAALAFSMAQSPVTAYALLPCLAFALYIPFSSQVVLGQKLLAKNMGFASGVTLGLSSTLGGIAQPVLGSIADAWGLPAVYQSLAVVGCIAALFACALAKKYNMA